MDQLRAGSAWRTTSGDSLPEVYRTIPIPKDARFWTKMGEFANPVWLKVAAWVVAAVIVGLNVKLLLDVAGLTA